GVHGHEAVQLHVVDVIAHQAFDIAEEDQSYELTVLVDDGRAGVSAGDVAGADEIERRGKVQLLLVRGIEVSRGQVKRGLKIKLVGALIKAVKGGPGRSLGAVHSVPLNCPEGEP